MNTRRAGTWLAATAAVAVVSTVVASILVMGPPGVQRQARLDERRVSHLQRIDRTVRAAHARDARLPRSLAQLASTPGVRRPPVDPQSARPYEYSVLGDGRYRLCAVFATDTANPAPGRSRYVPDGWHHASGRQCFDRGLEDE